MATLQTLTKITRDTIADGDKLNEAITSLTANDSAMLAETKTTNATTQEVFNTVKNTSGVKWNNDLVRNFANISVNGSTTLTGKSKLSSNVTFTGSDTINIEKTGNKYKFTPSNAINEVSSYYKYAKWDGELPLSRHSVDPFFGECAWGRIRNGSISLFDSYFYNAGGNGEYSLLDGFMKGCFVDEPTSTYRTTFSAERHPYLSYSATTNIFTSEDAPGLTGVVAHTIPTNGSFYVCDYFSYLNNNNGGPESYCGATIVDNGSIGLGNKVFAKNFSIGFKGCSAEDYSVCMFGGSNYNGFVLNNIAKTSSCAIGTNAIALNKSFVITNSVSYMPTNHTTPVNITADGCSFIMYTNASCTTNNVKTSSMYLLPASDSNTNTYVEKSFVIHNAGYKSSYKNRTLALGGFPNQYIFTREIDHSLITMNSMSYVKNSVSLYVKGTPYNSFNCLYNSVCTNVSYYGNLSATNSLILGVTYPSMITYSISHSAIDCIEIGRAVTAYQEDKDILLQQTVRFPGFEYDNKNHLLLLDTEPTYVTRASAHPQMENSIIILPGNRYYGGEGGTSDYTYDRAMKRFGRNNIGIKGTYYDVTPEHPTMIERNINIGYDRTSAVYSCKNNTLYNANIVQDFEQSLVYYASAVGYMYSNKHRVQKNAISLFYSNTNAGDSFAMNHSTIRTPQVVYGHGEVEVCTADNYCLSLFNSTASVTYQGTSEGEITGIQDDSTRLALWQNKLKTYDLPVTQFARITSINSLSELSTNIYYVIG